MSGDHNQYQKPKSYLDDVTPAPAQEPVARRAAWNKTIRDSVDSLLAQAGYEPDSSARYQLAMMNFDVPPAPAQPLPDKAILSCHYEDENMRMAFFRGWAKAEAAHGITSGEATKKGGAT